MNPVHRVQADPRMAGLLLDSNVDVIIVFDAEMVVVEWNRMAEQVYGLARPEVLGRRLTEVVPALESDKESAAAIALAMKQVKSFVPASGQYPHRARMENHYIPLVSQDEFIGVMNTGHDVSHRIRAEAQLEALNHRLETQYRHLQRTSNELASLTSLGTHDIKQPIRQVYMAVENLIQAEAGRLSDAGKAAFRRIQSSLNRMDLLLDDMLTLTGISVLETPVQQVHLDNVLPQALTGLRSRITGKGVQIKLSELCLVRGHAEQLRLLFHHLLSYVIRLNKSPHPAVEVFYITVTESRFPEVDYSERDYHRVTVADEGAGAEQGGAEVLAMAEELQADHTASTGAGLIIASKIMDVHEGFIRAGSTPGAGFFFHCYFPVPET